MTRKVRVIEDDEECLKVITYPLERLGYEVIASETGRRHQLAMAERADFVIHDTDFRTLTRWR